jgi:hypothetical protein
MMAISHAQTVLHWQEALMEEDMPPEWMWPLSEELDDWFDDVKARQAERYGTGSDSAEDAPDMAQNELTRHMKRR